MFRRILVLFLFVTLSGFIYCGGGGGGSTSASGVKWGYLLPETKGIYYSCGDLSGKTGPEGRF